MCVYASACTRVCVCVCTYMYLHAYVYVCVWAPHVSFILLLTPRLIPQLAFGNSAIINTGLQVSLWYADLIIWGTYSEVASWVTRLLEQHHVPRILVHKMLSAALQTEQVGEYRGCLSTAVWRLHTLRFKRCDLFGTNTFLCTTFWDWYRPSEDHFNNLWHRRHKAYSLHPFHTQGR